MHAAFTLPDTYVWDAWLSRANSHYYAFYLQAAKQTLTHPGERHHHASIGQAESTDLKKYRVIGTALQPGAGTTWDSLSLWNGSVIAGVGTQYLFYTGRSRGPGEFWIQRIGVATSHDWRTWVKYDLNPLLSAEPRYYAMADTLTPLGCPLGWRDPCVFVDPVSGRYAMTISANDTRVTSPYNGCIALAYSIDLLHWETFPPILSPGRYAEMEVSQVVYHDGRYYLFFSVMADKVEPQWRGAVSGLHCYCSDSLEGGYHAVNGNGVVDSTGETLYGVRVVEQTGTTSQTAVGWLNRTPRGEFLGGLSEPLTIHLDGDHVWTTL